MDNDTTFFSYSRSDSNFVLRLAKDLRSAGENLWLDQLDIPPGSRWDSSIEAALNKSTRLIVVLSPESVSSNNVMDEVSFALESGKTVIPVLYQQCVMPFRLRRLQHIDFTGDYDSALQRLIQSLSPPVTTAAAGKEALPNKDNAADRSVPPDRDRRTSQPANVEKPAANYKKYLLFFAALAIVAVAIWFFTKKDAAIDNPELLAWNNALANNDSILYVQYLADYPNGQYKQTAIQKIDSFKQAAAAASAVPGVNGTEVNQPSRRKPPSIEPADEPSGEPADKPAAPANRFPLKKTPFYAIMVKATKTQREAYQVVQKMRSRGEPADYLWIPDYASLSGAEFFNVYIGPFATQKECEIATEEYRKRDKTAYGLLVSQEKKRVQIYGVGKVRVTRN